MPGKMNPIIAEMASKTDQTYAETVKALTSPIVIKEEQKKLTPVKPSNKIFAPNVDEVMSFPKYITTEKAKPAKVSINLIAVIIAISIILIIIYLLIRRKKA